MKPTTAAPGATLTCGLCSHRHLLPLELGHHPRRTPHTLQRSLPSSLPQPSGRRCLLLQGLALGDIWPRWPLVPGFVHRAAWGGQMVPTGALGFPVLQSRSPKFLWFLCQGSQALGMVVGGAMVAGPQRRVNVEHGVGELLLGAIMGAKFNPVSTPGRLETQKKLVQVKSKDYLEVEFPLPPGPQCLSLKAFN
ncbi:hypothetical protein H1C71_039406 [Ictidomys tridecemlineatus]|nr:hypothetical protein H1C71_039406 [Ictidomys tridecemlineatus]